MRKLLWAAVGFLTVAFVAAPITGASEPKSATGGRDIEVAYVYVGPVGDAGWTFSHNESRLAVEKLPFVTKTTAVESVKEGAEATRVITQLAEAGHDLIFTTSFGFMDSTIEVAKKYPDVVFMHCSGYKRAENVGTYFGRMYQAKYLAGIVAAKMSDAGILGYVAPHPIPEVIRLINAYALGAQSVNPDIKVHVVWVNAWYDPGKEMDAAKALLDLGADVLSQGTDSASPQQAAQEAGVWSIGYDSDMSLYAPETHLTAPMWHWAVVCEKIAKEVSQGTWESRDIWWGIETGLVGLAPFHEAVLQDVRDQVADVKQQIVDGEEPVFEGPLKDQKGTVRVKDGVVMTDPDMLSMDWFVQGVMGSIPKTAGHD